MTRREDWEGGRAARSRLCSRERWRRREEVDSGLVDVGS